MIQLRYYIILDMPESWYYISLAIIALVIFVVEAAADQINITGAKGLNKYTVWIIFFLMFVAAYLTFEKDQLTDRNTSEVKRLEKDTLYGKIDSLQSEIRRIKGQDTVINNTRYVEEEGKTIVRACGSNELKFTPLTNDTFLLYVPFCNSGRNTAKNFKARIYSIQIDRRNDSILRTALIGELFQPIYFTKDIPVYKYEVKVHKRFGFGPNDQYIIYTQVDWTNKEIGIKGPVRDFFEWRPDRNEFIVFNNKNQFNKVKKELLAKNFWK